MQMSSHQCRVSINEMMFDCVCAAHVQDVCVRVHDRFHQNI